MGFVSSIIRTLLLSLMIAIPCSGQTVRIAYRGDSSSRIASDAFGRMGGLATNLYDSLMLWYRFDKSSFTNTPDYADWSRGFLDGTQGTAASQPQWRSNGCGSVYMDGTNDWIEIPRVFGALTNITLAAWVNETAGLYNDLFVFGDGSPLNKNFAIFYVIDANNVRWQVHGSAGALVLGDTGVLAWGGRWHHIAVTVNPLGNLIYIDGTNAPATYNNGNASTTASIADVPTANDHSTLGRFLYNGTYYSRHQGLVDDTMIYSRALSAAEILQLCNATRMGKETVTVTGGTITNYAENGTNFMAHIFTNNGINTFAVSNGTIICDFIIVAGGGGGGAGGGGAGGMITSNRISIPAGNYTVVVGGGGKRGNINTTGGTGTNSSFFGSIALGGGGGGGDMLNGAGGGSGGGAGWGADKTGGGGTYGQGNAGGNAGYYSSPYPTGGGGGAGAVGQSAQSASEAGDGGAGLSSTLSGSLAWYSGGGGGAQYSAGGSPGVGGSGVGGDSLGGSANPGTINTGSGGGGVGNFAPNQPSGEGGSGIVIIRYQR